MEKMREEFEAWSVSIGYDTIELKVSEETGNYENTEVLRLYTCYSVGWQASRAALRAALRVGLSGDWFFSGKLGDDAVAGVKHSINSR